MIDILEVAEDLTTTCSMYAQAVVAISNFRSFYCDLAKLIACYSFSISVVSTIWPPAHLHICVSEWCLMRMNIPILLELLDYRPALDHCLMIWRFSLLQITFVLNQLKRFTFRQIDVPTFPPLTIRQRVEVVMKLRNRKRCQRGSHECLQSRYH